MTPDQALESINKANRRRRQTHAHAAAGLRDGIEAARRKRKADLRTLEAAEERWLATVGETAPLEAEIPEDSRPWQPGPDGERHPDLAALAEEVRLCPLGRAKRQPDNWRADREVAARWARADGLARLDRTYRKTDEYQSSREAAKWLAGRPVRWEREAAEALERRREAIREGWPRWLRARARVLAVRAEDQRLREAERAEMEAHRAALEPKIERASAAFWAAHRSAPSPAQRAAERADALLRDQAGNDPPEGT